ncbi:sarcoplasmic reticulum histidine-rich calcium-binding protein-like [Zingiber officinale]|uniref:sarcoplasmic reticulum histidine-rich calcium-binding protein-like n=1 Tax=Zingiber officinale TaxID=94328 RepID=UPI001C4CA75D|nr:sarcoplasmic reticulum histidine-rich calcium-binding protein-like [Zingiber officinale]
MMRKQEDDDFYSLIDLNHIFHDDDILNEWTRDNEPPVLEDDDLAWLDQALRASDAEEYNTTTSVQSHSRKKNKGKEVLSRDDSEDSDESDDSDDSDDSNDGNDQQSHGEHHIHQSHQDDQHDTGMTWAQGHENYYATQDSNHGYRPGMEKQHHFFTSLSESADAKDKEHSIGSSRQHMSVEEHMKHLLLRGNQQIPLRDDYGSRSYNWESQDIGHGPIGYQLGGYGYYSSNQPRYDSYDRSSDYLPSYTSAIRHHESEGYFDNAQNAIPVYSTSLGSNIGHHSRDRESSSGTSSSIGYHGFGYYNRRDETLLQSQSSNSEHISSTQPNEYPYGQFNPNIYQCSYVGDQFNQYDTQGEYNEDFVPPRHSSWY